MPANRFAAIPSIEQMLQRADMQTLVGEAGHTVVRDCLRTATQAMRQRLAHADAKTDPTTDVATATDVAHDIAQATTHAVTAACQTSMGALFNLTGTVLHTNLGRAVLPESAITALNAAARHPVNVEFDLQSGKRGDRDAHVEGLLKQLTGAQAATVVNNNAAAVILCLNTLALNREVAVSRGELVEIGGSFRMPDIMASAGCKLVEVGTTNRTHLSDYENAIGENSAALMTVDPSNYVVKGFTTQLNKSDIADVAHRHQLPLIDDLGSGALVDLKQFGLPHETTVRESVVAGADLVTFSGDKLLGGPQAGMIVGSHALIQRIKRNPMKRALRLDKLRLAALEAVLRHYLVPEKLVADLPTLRFLTRSKEDIAVIASQALHACRSVLSDHAQFELIDCKSQIGSGALPADLLPSVGIAIAPVSGKSGRGAALAHWTSLLRELPRPVIGRLHEDRLILDMRTMMPDELAGFIAQLDALTRSLNNGTTQPEC